MLQINLILNSLCFLLLVFADECKLTNLRDKCDFDFAQNSNQVGYPTLKSFEIFAIESLSDNSLGVSIDFEIDQSLAEKCMPQVDTIEIVDLLTGQASMKLYDRDQNYNIIGNLYSFSTIWMYNGNFDKNDCLPPFVIMYTGSYSNLNKRAPWYPPTYANSMVYYHSCPDTEFSGDIPQVCWEEICDVYQETTTELEIGEPSTIETFPPNVSPTTDCPTAFGTYLCGASTKVPPPPPPPPPAPLYPLLLNLEYHSIKSVGGGHLYEVMIEFEIESHLLVNNLKSIYIKDLSTPDNYLTSLELYNRDSINLVGDSPFHFFLKWVMATNFYGTYTCTGPFSVVYDWEYLGEIVYIHSCDDDRDSPLECWEDICEPPAGEPSIIISTDPSLPEPTECLTSFSDAPACEVVADTSISLIPETLKFVYIHFIEDDLYEVMLEFKLDLPYQFQGRILVIEMKPGDSESEGDPWTLYDSQKGVDLVGDSPYHFYLVWVMNAQQVGSLKCTTPFRINYEWNTGYIGYGHGCDPSRDAYAVQCWDEVCERPAEETTAEDETTTEEGSTTEVEVTTEAVTKEPTEEPTVTVTETGDNPSSSFTRTVTVTITDVNSSTTREFTETATYKTNDPPPVTRTLTETITRTDVDPTTTREVTETVTYTIVDPPPPTKTLIDTLTTVIIDPETPTVSTTVALTTTLTTTDISSSLDPSSTAPIPPPGDKETDVTITVTRPDTTYVTTVAKSSNPPNSFTTIAGSVTTITYSTVSSSIPTESSGTPDEEFVQDPNVLTYTKTIPTTIVPDGKTFDSSVLVAYTTSAPKYSVAPAISTSAGTDGLANSDLEEFLAGAPGIKSNIFVLFLCLISTILLVRFSN